ncbi:MAG: citryl-CoA lyase [Ramlibacter sp.]|nr:citryl-CoA lyase [Ramlibacter sp.]
MRSKLFVPASRPELFDKALNGPADALSFDLEDSVAEDRKDEARGALRQLLRSGVPAGCAKTLIVRINALGTTHFEADVAAVVQPGLHLLNLPKPGSVDDVLAAVSVIERAERENGVAEPVRLLINIETPRALRIAHELAGAHPRVAGLQLGLGDLFEPLGIGRRQQQAVFQAMLAVRLAAGEAGVFAYDSAFADIADAQGFSVEAQQARELGFLGKSCIHPSQVALANAAFQPTAAEIENALRVVEAARVAQLAGVGAYVVGGKMVDAPFVRRAEAIVAAATRLGLIAR